LNGHNIVSDACPSLRLSFETMSTECRSRDLNLSLYSIHIFLTKSDGSRENEDSRTDPWPNFFNHMGNFEFSFYSICSGGIKEKNKA
jgi:hypothetical protein